MTKTMFIDCQLHWRNTLKLSDLVDGSGLMLYYRHTGDDDDMLDGMDGMDGMDKDDDTNNEPLYNEDMGDAWWKSVAIADHRLQFTTALLILLSVCISLYFNYDNY